MRTHELTHQLSPSVSDGPHNAPAHAGGKRLFISVVAYVSAVSASTGAALAVVGAGVPLDLLLAVA